MNGTASSTKLPFFHQVVVSPDFNTPVAGTLYRLSESYWSFNPEKAYVVSVVNKSDRLATIDTEKKPSWITTALKILACVTIIPIILLGIKALVRFIHPIHVEQRPLSPSQFTNVAANSSPPTTSSSSSNVSSNHSTDEYDSRPSPSNSTSSTPTPESSEEDLAALGEFENGEDRPSKAPKKVSFIDELPVDDCGYVTLSTMPVHLTQVLNDETKESLWEKAVEAEKNGNHESAMLYYIDYALVSSEDDTWGEKGKIAVQKSLELHVQLYKEDLLIDVNGDDREKFFELIRIVRDKREIDPRRISEILAKTIPLKVQFSVIPPIVPLPETVRPIYQLIGPFTAAIHSRQNNRSTQEDTYLISEFQIEQQNQNPVPAYFFGVFDGHGGTKCADYVRDKIIDELKRTFSYYTDLSDFAIFNSLKRACVVLNQKWSESPLSREQSGTTASMALIVNNTLWFFNVGDSRAILAKGDTVIQGSVDAKPTDPQFIRGILKRGGYLSNNGGWRLGGTLALARAFGDKGADGITARPKISKHDLKDLKADENNFLVIASDGLWDVFGSRQAAETIQQTIPGLDRKPTVEELAFYLTETSSNQQKGDNCTVLTVNLTPNPAQKSIEEKESLQTVS